MKRYIAILFSSLSLILLGLPVAYAAMTVPPVPTNGYVLDQTNTLNEEQIAQLNTKISSHRDKTSVQLAVLIVPEISKDDYLERFSLNVARTWGIGEKDKNNGALLLIAKNDRQVRIEVGTGLEGDLTDARASRIIRDRITPEFRQNNYYAGIASGLDGIELALGSAPDGQLQASSAGSPPAPKIGDTIMLILAMMFLFFSWFGAVLGRTKNWWAGGVLGGVLGGTAGFFLGGGTVLSALFFGIPLIILGLLFDYIVSKNYKNAVSDGSTPAWWAGGTHFGGGGGGFGGGFGGGGFGGGGASGSW